MNVPNRRRSVCVTRAQVHRDETDVAQYGNSTDFLPFQIAFLSLMPFRIYLSCASFVHWQYLAVWVTEDTKNCSVEIYPLNTILRRNAGQLRVLCT